MKVEFKADITLANFMPARTSCSGATERAARNLVPPGTTSPA